MKTLPRTAKSSELFVTYTLIFCVKVFLVSSNNNEILRNCILAKYPPSYHGDSLYITNCTFMNYSMDLYVVTCKLGTMDISIPFVCREGWSANRNTVNQREEELQWFISRTEFPPVQGRRSQIPSSSSWFSKLTPFSWSLFQLATLFSFFPLL